MKKTVIKRQEKGPTTRSLMDEGSAEVLVRPGSLCIECACSGSGADKVRGRDESEREVADQPTKRARKEMTGDK